MGEGTASAGPDKAAPCVFISYSHEDRKRALPIIRLITDAGFPVWWDGMLEGGARYALTTETALNAANAVVVLWSKTSVASHWVHDEATRGRDRRCLVPISIDGTPPPLGFGQFQTIDLSRSKLRTGDPEVDTMLRAIGALHERTDVTPAPALAVVKGIDRRLVIGGGVAAVAAGATAAWWGGLLGGKGSPNSVAVLPFANMSDDQSQRYFSDGVAAEVRAVLARNPQLQVVAQASSEAFRDRREDARAIAQKLRVSHLLDGNVRKSGDTVRVSVELTEGATGFTKWSQQFDRPLVDVFAVQDEIAGAVASALSAELSAGTASGKVDLGGTDNFAAYDAYLRGNALYQLSSGEAASREALAQYDKAIATDPGFASAWSARSRTLASIANQYLDGTARATAFSAAIASAEKARTLAPDLADAHSALGYATFFGRRNAKAARGAFERSAALGQGESDVMSRYALYCARIGEIETARTAIARAAALDPLNALTQRSVGTVEFTARLYADSITAYTRALTMNPEMSGTHAAIGFSQLLSGQVDAAAASFARERSALRRLTGVAMVAHRQGRTGEAQAAFAQVERDFGTSAVYEEAQILAQWGEKDRAMAWLLKARDTGDPGLVLIRSDPLIDPLRGLPAFSDLLKQAGFA